jgi:hypothetical protein
VSDGKVLIMGTGGCGSGFLWGLLGACGLETLGINEWMRHSGIRDALASGTADTFKYPKVIKHLGGFLVNLNKHIDENHWEVEHIFFAVASYDLQIRSYVRRRGKSIRDGIKTKEQVTEESKLDYEKALGRGLLQLIERDHPFTMVRCPRSILDSKYCYDKVKIVLNGMTYEQFKKIHDAAVIPGKVEELKRWA